MEHLTWNIKQTKKDKQIVDSSHAPYSMFRVSSGKGFTLVELLIVITIAGLISVLTMGVFSKMVEREVLDKKTAIVVSLLNQARASTLSAQNAQSYGVHFESGKAVLFIGPTYSAGATTNKEEIVGGRVSIPTITLAGGESNVLFNRLTGATAQTGTVTLSLIASPAQTKVITINGTGVVSSN